MMLEHILSERSTNSDEYLWHIIVVKVIFPWVTLLYLESAFGSFYYFIESELVYHEISYYEPRLLRRESSTLHTFSLVLFVVFCPQSFEFFSISFVVILSSSPSFFSEEFSMIISVPLLG